MSLDEINGRNLNAPLNKNLLNKLHHMIQSQKDLCMSLAEKYLKRWRKKDDKSESKDEENFKIDYSIPFLNQEKVIVLKEFLGLLAQYDLIDDAQEIKDGFMASIERANLLINHCNEH